MHVRTQLSTVGFEDGFLGVRWKGAWNEGLPSEAELTSK